MPISYKHPIGNRCPSLGMDCAEALSHLNQLNRPGPERIPEEYVRLQGMLTRVNNEVQLILTNSSSTESI